MSKETALAVIKQVGSPTSFCKEMQAPIAAIMNLKTFEDGSSPMAQAIALQILMEGSTPLDFQRQNHIILGKVSMKADAMLANFRTQYGGRHKVIEASPKRAAIEIQAKNEDAQEFEFTWEQAKRSRWPWGKDVVPPQDLSKVTVDMLKDNWSTDEDRENMLWARLVSKVLRRVCPEVAAGVYTPEEIMDFVDDEERPATTVTSTVSTNDGRPLPNEPEVEVVDDTQPPADETKGRPEVETTEPDKDNMSTQSNTGFPMGQQKYELITKLVDELDLDSKQLKSVLVENYKVQSLRDMTAEAADVFIGKLKNAIAKQGADSSP